MAHVLLTFGGGDFSAQSHAIENLLRVPQPSDAFHIATIMVGAGQS